MSAPQARRRASSSSSSSSTSAAAAAMTSSTMVGVAVAIVAVVAVVIALCYCCGSGSSSCTTNPCAVVDPCCPGGGALATPLADRVFVLPADQLTAATSDTRTWTPVSAVAGASLTYPSAGWVRVTVPAYASTAGGVLVAASAATAPATGTTPVTNGTFATNAVGVAPYWSAHVVSAPSGVFDVPLPAGFLAASSTSSIYLMISKN